jgi:hypothetical protein
MKKLESSENVKIDDMGVHLSPGTPVWVSDSQATSSRCLSTLVRLGKVQISESMKSRAFRGSKEKVPNKVQPTMPAAGHFTVSVPVAVQSSILTNPQPSVDIEHLAKTTARLTVSEVIKHLDIEGRVENAVKKAMATAVFVVPSGSPQVQVRGPQGPEEPIFIPTGIVKSGPSEISVQSSVSESGGLGDAAKALKSLKTKKS